MKIVVVTLFLLASNIAYAEQATVNIKGMVCAFCAQGIEKAFLSKHEVKKVKVDLETKKVTLTFKDKKSLNNEAIKKVILDSGYNTESIERNPAKQ